MIYVYSLKSESSQPTRVWDSTEKFLKAFTLKCECAGDINPYLRDEIRNFPMVEELIGPMYDGKDEFGGTKVRYETEGVYNILST